MNRLLQEVRKIFNDHKGGEGNAYWAFDKIGQVTILNMKSEKNQEELIEDSIQLGASDFQIEENEINVRKKRIFFFLMD